MAKKKFTSVTENGSRRNSIGLDLKNLVEVHKVMLADLGFYKQLVGEFEQIFLPKEGEGGGAGAEFEQTNLKFLKGGILKLPTV